MDGRISNLGPAWFQPNQNSVPSSWYHLDAWCNLSWKVRLKNRTVSTLISSARGIYSEYEVTWIYFKQE